MAELINQVYYVVTVLLCCYSTIGMLLTFFKKDSLRYKWKMKLSGKDYLLLSAYTYLFFIMGLIDTQDGYSIGVLAVAFLSCVAVVVALIYAIYKWHTNLQSS